MPIDTRPTASLLRCASALTGRDALDWIRLARRKLPGWLDVHLLTRVACQLDVAPADVTVPDIMSPFTRPLYCARAVLKVI